MECKQGCLKFTESNKKSIQICLEACSNVYKTAFIWLPHVFVRLPHGFVILPHGFWGNLADLWECHIDLQRLLLHSRGYLVIYRAASWICEAASWICEATWCFERQRADYWGYATMQIFWGCLKYLRGCLVDIWGLLMEGFTSGSVRSVIQPFWVCKIGILPKRTIESREFKWWYYTFDVEYWIINYLFN